MLLIHSPFCCLSFAGGRGEQKNPNSIHFLKHRISSHSVGYTLPLPRELGPTFPNK